MTLTLPGMEAPNNAAISQYDTPPDLAAALCSLVDVRDRVVLEPSAGRGNLVAAILAAGAKHVIAVEMDPARCDVLRERFAAERTTGRVSVIEHDFLTVDPPSLIQVDLVVGNPPYDDGADTAHVAHALTFVPDGAPLALLLRTVFLHGQERREVIWSRCRIGAIEPVSARVKFGSEAGKIDVSLFRVFRGAPETHERVIVRFR